MYTCPLLPLCLLTVLSLHIPTGSSSRFEPLQKRLDEVRDNWYFTNSHPNTILSSRDDDELPPNKVSSRSRLSVNIAVNDLTRILEASRDNRSKKKVSINWMSPKRSEVIRMFNNPKRQSKTRSEVLRVRKFDNPGKQGLVVLLVCLDDDSTTTDSEISRHVTRAPQRSRVFNNALQLRQRFPRLRYPLY